MYSVASVIPDNKLSAYRHIVPDSNMTKQFWRLKEKKWVRHVKAHFTKQVFKTSKQSKLLWLKNRRQARPRARPPSGAPPQNHAQTLPGAIPNCLRLICERVTHHVNTPEKEARFATARRLLSPFLFSSSCEKAVTYFTCRTKTVRGRNKRWAMWQRQREIALVSHVVCFWEPTQRSAVHSGEITFCFDLIKAKYWAIVRHLAGYAWHCNYLLRCFCLKGCIHAWNQFQRSLVKGCTFFCFFERKKKRICLLTVPLSRP